MGIEKIKSNFDAAPSSRFKVSKPVGNRIYLGEIKDTTSFTGGTETVAKTVKPLKDILLGIMPKSAKRMVKMHEGMGEIQNQLINAVGTGLIAPVFIKFNPMSDTDEDTRTYTAWRQPVSAVLAVGTQCAIVKPFNDLIRWMSDIGYFGQKYNATLFPSDNYAKKVVKEKFAGKTLSKDELAKEVKNFQKEKANALKEMISNDQIIFDRTELKNGKTVVSKMPMSETDFNNLFTETLDQIIKDEEKQKLNAIDIKLPKKLERSIFYHNHPEESRKILERVNSKIKESYNTSEFGTTTVEFNPKELNKEFNTIISELKAESKNEPSKKAVNDELIKIVKDLKNRNTSKDAAAVRILNKKIESMLDNINVVASKKSTQEIIEHVNQAIYKRTNSIDEVISTLTGIRDRINGSGITVKEAQAIIDEKIKTSRNSVLQELRARGLQDNEIKETAEYSESLAVRLKQKAGSISGCIADQLKKHVKSNIDGSKRWTGLAVSLAILPVTCWMLNKIYPWFMDLAFPNLSKKEEKPQDQDKKVEVK